MITNSKGKGTWIDTVTKIISEDEMDRLLDMQHDEVVQMLDEARAQQERGEFAPLEPLHEFLKEARENFEAGE